MVDKKIKKYLTREAPVFIIYLIAALYVSYGTASRATLSGAVYLDIGKFIIHLILWMAAYALIRAAIWVFIACVIRKK
ncbi:MAG: hypothetical protein WBD24_00905 [Candidatus Omnitrophota bacterium]